MRTFRDLSLKTRLVASFVAVVVVSALLGSVVYTVVLVSTMKESAREKIEETAKVAFTQIDQKSRGLEIYTDLIASDMTFGQVLSFDSSLGILQKIEEFTRLSQADVVAFVPAPDRYIQIKDQVFTNAGNEALAPILSSSAMIRKLTEPASTEAKRGWVSFGEDVYLLAMKPVLHFGANMGVIVLALRTKDEFAKEIAAATGTGIVLFNARRVLGSSHDKSVSTLPDQASLASATFNKKVVEDYTLAGTSYFSLFVPLKDLENKSVATLGIQVSNATIREARNRTLRQVLLVAALAAMLSAAIGYILARAISTPLQTITKGILSIIDHGDLGIRIPGKFGAEIGILTNSFNRLLGQLQDAHEKLASSERRMKEELTNASTVQEMLFPERATRFEGLELASFIDNSTETGGDWYGYSQDRIGKNVSVMIGDVTGHGMPAALITAIADGFFKGVHEAEDTVRQILKEMESNPEISGNEKAMLSVLERFRGTRQLSTADLLSILNQMILTSTKGSLLMTFFASVYDPVRSELRYANAGHNRPFFYQAGENGNPKIGVLPSSPSSRLGETADLAFEENTFKLGPDDIVLWYTDGILECENPAGEMYGKRRLMNVLKDIARGATAESIRDAIITDSYKFFGDRQRKDDITLVVGKVLGY